jgi:hypothetical protein
MVALALAVGVAGGAVAADQDVDQGDGATGAVQNGSNAALAGNGGDSLLNSEAAEIAVGDIEMGDGSTNEIRLTSTIETQISSADGGDLNHASVSDNDPVTDDRDVDQDNRETTNNDNRETALNNEMNVVCIADQDITQDMTTDLSGAVIVGDTTSSQSGGQEVGQDCDATLATGVPAP